MPRLSRMNLPAPIALLLAVFCSGIASGAEPMEVSVMTFNIRYGTASDGEHAWPHRKETVARFIGESALDFVGIQESLASQTTFLRKEVGGTYDMIVRTRERVDGRGEATPLLYRKDRWELDPERHGTFWLSLTPEEPGSKSWDSSLPRIATWGRFTERTTGRPIWVLNTHFDHRSAPARHEAGRLIARRLGELVPAGEPVVVLGDLNARPDTPPLQALQAGAGERPILLIDAWKSTNPDGRHPCTFNGWGEGMEGRRIDHVLVSPGVEILACDIERERIDGRPISDHWPVRANLRVPETSKGSVDRPVPEPG
ncbi:MAG: endonuclease/exonuclease/phosphatase family protein [Phycisphaerales bacterium]|nr:endonuclease/exonuclease/phosphatase family protein [Phycisphaerales bacterium]